MPSKLNHHCKRDLLHRAEERLKTNKKDEPLRTGQVNLKKLVHDLEVHQIELEMQNEELRRAWREIEASRNRFADLYNFAPIGYFTIDSAGQIREVNLTGAGLLGMERGLLIGKPFSQWILADSQDVFYLHMKAVLRSGERKTCELLLGRKDGTSFHALLDSVVASAPDDIHDKPGQFRTAVIDITAKHERDALKTSELVYRLLFELNPAGIFRATLNPDTLEAKRIQCNDAFARLLGYASREELEAEEEDFIFPSGNDWKKYVPRLLRDKSLADIEVCLRRRDGKSIWVLAGFVLTENKVDHLPVVEGTIVNITDRKTTEKKLQASNRKLRSLTAELIAAQEALKRANDELESKVKERTVLLAETNRALTGEIEERRRIADQLRQSEDTYRLLFENNIAGVFRSILDPATREVKRIECNDAYAGILGYASHEELLADRATKTTFAFEEERNKYINELRKKKKLVNYETRRLRKDGKLVWILTNASLRKMEGSDKMLLEGTVADITSRKKAEEEMRIAHRKLRAMASEIVRTEEKERQHIAAVLHDTVAQTLAAAKMKFEALQDCVLSEGLGTMEDVRDLLAQSIKQTRSILAELSPPILNEIGFVPALEWLTEQIEDECGLLIHFRCAGDPQPLPHDIDVLLYQATRELLMNVVKHAKAKRAMVTVSEESGGVQVEVCDDGIGLDQSRAGYQGDPGGGFGLFSIRERLKHLGGHLDIRSQKGKGTKCALIIPREIINRGKAAVSTGRD